MNIGILGGTFDPIHNGHMHMAYQSLIEYNLDEIWIIPAGHSPNKDENKMTSAYHRLNMCNYACSDNAKIKALDYEIKSNERSYTYRTLERLKEDYPEDNFYFIMGGDSIDYFEDWSHPEIISKLCVILVVVREGFPLKQINDKIDYLKKKFPCDIRIVHCKQYDISSSKIRNDIRKKIDVSEFLNSDVYNYIRKNNLYNM